MRMVGRRKRMRRKRKRRKRKRFETPAARPMVEEAASDDKKGRGQLKPHPALTRAAQVALPDKCVILGKGRHLAWQAGGD